MRRLYASIYASLHPQGCFFNLDTASAPDEFLRELFRGSRRAERPQAEAQPAPASQVRHSVALDHHREATLKRHLAWLDEAGFKPVDCFWKRLEQALVGGYKR
jgi:trans-aconitate 2-methyltransferase